MLPFVAGVASRITLVHTHIHEWQKDAMPMFAPSNVGYVHSTILGSSIEEKESRSNQRLSHKMIVTEDGLDSLTEIVEIGSIWVTYSLEKKNCTKEEESE